MELSIANTGVKDLLVQRMRGDNKITNSIINDYGCSIHSIEIFICKRKETNLERNHDDAQFIHFLTLMLEQLIEKQLIRLL